MTTHKADVMTAMESLIYTFARNQFAQNSITPAEARIVMECVNSKFRWNYIDACMIDRLRPAEGAQKEGADNADNNDKT